jgi:hypothetical protein
LSNTMAITSKPSAGFRGFFLAPPLDEGVAGGRRATRGVTAATPPLRRGATGSATSWTMGAAATMEALVDSRAVVKRSGEERGGGAALAAERGGRETDDMGEASPMLVVVVVGGDCGGWGWREAPRGHGRQMLPLLGTLRQEMRGRQWEFCAGTIGSPRNAKLEHRDFSSRYS